MDVKSITAIWRGNASFFKDSSIIFAGSFLVNLLNYVFTLLMGRVLNVEEFGEVAALLSLFLIISVPATALTMLMAREAAQYRGVEKNGVRHIYRQMSRYSLIGGGALWLVFLILIPFVGSYLQIPTLPLFIFSILVPLTILGALQSGTLQGLQEFLSLSYQGVLGTVIKLLGSIALVSLGYSVAGVMGALVLASICSLTYGYFATRKRLASAEVSSDGTQGRIKLFGSILATTFLLALLSNVDVLLAKHYLARDLAGQYGALSTVGKILIYGVGAFITVLLPMAAAAHARGQGEEKRVLGLSLGAVAAASLTACAVFSLFPHLIVSLLFGGRYALIEPHLGAFALAMAAIALSTVFINYFIATRNTSFVYLLGVGIVLEIALIALYHGSLAVITQSLLLSSVFLLILMAGNYLFMYRPRTTFKS